MRLSLLVALFTALPGCAFPRFLPGQAGAIRAVDAETGMDLPDAKVRFRSAGR